MNNILKKKVLVLLISVFLFSDVVNAQANNQLCAPKGYTIATVNGIFTDEDGAKINMTELQKRIGLDWKGEFIDFKYFHNPSHLGGLGDVAMSAYQKLFEDSAVKDYDLVEILKTASANIKTQKVLLVGYSQGNFYTNSFYDVVAGQSGGIPKESISVYSVATPAGRVAGGGSWLTSTSDKVISKLVEKFPFRDVMKPNTNIDLRLGDDLFGHSFTDVYLKYRGDKIVSDIKKSLNQLEIVEGKTGPCIKPPKKTFLHGVQGTVLSIADPIAETGVAATIATVKGAVKTTRALAGLAGKVIGAVTGSSKVTADESDSKTVSIMEEDFSEEDYFAYPETFEPAPPAPTATAAELKSQMDKIQKRIDEIKTERPVVVVTEEPKAQTLSEPKLTVANPPPPPNPPKQPTQKASPPPAPPPAPTPPPATATSTANLIFPSSNPVNKEILVSLSASNLGSAIYDLKISIESGGVLSDIYDEIDWKSSNFYLLAAVPGPTANNRQFRLKIKDNKQSFRGPAEIIVKLRKNGLSTSATLYAGTINIGEPVSDGSFAPPPAPSPNPPPPPPAPQPSPPPPAPAPIPPTETSATAPNHLLISQVQITGGIGAATNDFIEIHNPTSAAINLNGYRLVKRTAAGISDTLIKSWTDDIVIQPGDYYLWANNGFVDIAVIPDSTTSASIANDNGIAIRFGPNDTGEIIDSVAWGSAENVFVEGFAFATNPVGNESIIRYAIQDSLCVSALGPESTGNGCDRDNNSIDFELNSTSAPRHLSVQIDDSIISYDRANMELDLNWLPLEGASYEIVDVSVGEAKLSSITTEFSVGSFPIREAGRDYALEIRALDSEENILKTWRASISVPSLAEVIYFYRDPRASEAEYLVEVDYPYTDKLIPNIHYQDASQFQIIVFYLNSESYLERGEQIVSGDDFAVANADKALPIKYKSCTNLTISDMKYLLIPQSANVCISGHPSGPAYTQDHLEDGYILINALDEEADSFSSSDYITAAYYSLSYTGSGGQQFRLVATDRQKYYFSDEAPSHFAPPAPTNIDIIDIVDGGDNSRVILEWDVPKDPDTADYALRYEWKTEDSAYADVSLESIANGRYRGNILLEKGSIYEVKIRAVDNFDLVSGSSAINIDL